MSTHTPHHARSFPRFPRRAKRSDVVRTEATVTHVWLPEPIDLAPQAVDELARMAKARRDAWAGSRDTDRQA